MEDVEMREDLIEAAVGAGVREDGLWLGDAIHFFLSAKRAGATPRKPSTTTARSSSSSSAASPSTSKAKTPPPILV